MLRRVAAVVAALVLAAPAAAATVDDLPSLGYSVHVAWQQGGCTVYNVAAPWLTIYLNSCDVDFQASVDNLADPVLHFERRWQHDHPDQLDAATRLASVCYSVNRTAPATDAWRVIGGVTDLTVPGAQLPALAQTLPPLRLPDGNCPTGTGASVTVPSTDGSGAILVPGATVATLRPGTGTTTAASGSRAATDEYVIRDPGFFGFVAV
jgi:hypothetical protein